MIALTPKQEFAIYKNAFHNSIASDKLVAKLWEMHTKAFFKIKGEEFRPQHQPIQGRLIK